MANICLESQPQPQQNVAIDIDARFGPSCAPVLTNTDVVNSIIKARQGMDRRNWLYLLLSCAPSFAIMCVAFSARAAIQCSSE